MEKDYSKHKKYAAQCVAAILGNIVAIGMGFVFLMVVAGVWWPQLLQPMAQWPWHGGQANMINWLAFLFIFSLIGVGFYLTRKHN